MPANARQRRANEHQCDIGGFNNPNRDKNVTPTKPAQPLRFSRPIRYSPQLKKSGSHARMDRARIVAHDAPYDPPAEPGIFSKDKLERRPEGFARGYLPLHWGAGAEPRISGRSPQCRSGPCPRMPANGGPMNINTAAAPAGPIRGHGPLPQNPAKRASSKHQGTHMPKVTKAVIPVAGLGTRMLPASKAIPKEMLTLADKPLIQYVVNECAAAGITEIILVTHSSKNAIENHFDTSFEL